MHRLYSDRDTGFWRFFSATRLLACRDLPCAREKLAFLVHALELRRPAVLTDPGAAVAGGVPELLSDLPGTPLMLGAESDVGPMRQALEELRAERCDGIVAIGGGSVLDSAKLIAAALGEGCALESLAARQQARSVPVIAVPTTFGSGSEVNIYGHLRDASQKRGVRREWLAPAAALLVGEIAAQVPRQLRYLGGVDAWLHAFEALGLKRETSPIQQALLGYALESHGRVFRRYVEAPDADNGLEMATVSALAGLGLNNARTGLLHTLAGPFAGVAALPHAASLLPFVEPGIRFLWDGVATLLPGRNIEHALAQLRESLLFDAPGVLAAFRCRLSPSTIDSMVEGCRRDTVLLKENPVALAPGDYHRLYREALAPWLGGQFGV